MLDKDAQTIDNIPFKWFEGALLNYAENLLRFDDDKVALYSSGKPRPLLRPRARYELLQRRALALKVRRSSR